LKRLPIETLKIDQTFVADLILSEDSRAIVNATIVLAHNLNLRVVAEGVETRAQHEALRRMGCDAFQGYLHSQALKTPAFYSLLGLPTP
jgi:EAL domain-containing protein (putative c-di-GMP-specific phosphodiesterase class I)